jgi:UDP-2,3-diacylglucosamine hydrolase
MAPRKTRTNPAEEADAAETGPLAIIAGGGPLPCTLAASAAAKGRPVHIIGLSGEADAAIARFPHSWMKWGEIGKLFAILQRESCRDLVIIGSVTRPDVKNLKVDFGALKSLPFLLSLGSGGDDRILSSIVRFFEARGHRVLGAGAVAPELLAPQGLLGRKAPSPDDEADIAVGFRVVQALGRLDIGQAAVIVDGHVLAVEAAEGTDAMLTRASALRQNRYRFRRRRLGVLVKAPKPGQELRIDLPTIGPRTVEKAAEAGLSGIAFAAGRVLIAERAQTVAAANRLRLFLLGRALDEGLADASDA